MSPAETLDRPIDPDIGNWYCKRRCWYRCCTRTVGRHCWLLTTVGLGRGRCLKAHSQRVVKAWWSKLQYSQGSCTQTWTLTSKMVAGAHGILTHRPQNALPGAGTHWRKHLLLFGSAASGANIQLHRSPSRALVLPWEAETGSMRLCSSGLIVSL